MGISRFYSFLFQNYPNAHIQCEKNKTFDYSSDILAIDMNNILHMCAQQVFEYGSYSHTKRFLSKKNANKYDYFRRVCFILDSIVEYIKPKTNLILCIDGVGSLAKIKQQRIRRYKCLLDYKELEDVENSCKNLKFNPNEISPGTVLMDELSKYINWHIHNSVSTNNYWKNLSVIFSNEKVPGEGEHKIFTILRTLDAENKSLCIYGIDADLIMLSLLNLKHCQGIYLLRENLFNDNFICIDIQQIYSQIISEFSTYVKDYKESDQCFLLYDFILIFFFFGNDFLPEIPSVDIEFVSFIFNEYKSVLNKFGYLTIQENDLISFNSKNFKEFLFACSTIESDLLYKKTLDDFFPSTILNNSIEKESVNLLKFNKLYNESKLDNNCQQIVHDYLSTCIWNLNYYIGKHIDWSWTFNHYYSPTFTSLFYFFDSYKHRKFNTSYAIPPFLQLIYIIPYHHRYVLPETLHDLIPIVKPKDIILDFTMKRSDREAVVVIPQINQEKILGEYNLRKHLFYKDDRNIVGKNIYYYRSNSSFYYNSKWKDIPNCNVIKQFKS